MTLKQTSTITSVFIRLKDVYNTTATKVAVKDLRHKQLKGNEVISLLATGGLGNCAVTNIPQYESLKFFVTMDSKLCNMVELCSFDDLTQWTYFESFLESLSQFNMMDAVEVEVVTRYYAK